MEIVYHIGYAKCATTYLQKRVFPNLKGANYIGRYIHDKNLPYIYDLPLKDNIDQKSIQNLIESESYSDQINIISHEVILRPNKNERTFRRIKSCSSAFTNIKIILSIRNQFDLIRSRYIHDINTSHFSKSKLSEVLDFEGVTRCQWPVCKIRSFEKLFPFFSKCSCFRDGGKHINLKYYDYMAMHKTLLKYFSEENIHYLILENLRANPMEELGLLTTFLNVPQFSQETINSFKDKRDNTSESKQIRARIDQNTELEIRGFFQEANMKFNSVVGRRLEKWNYW